MPNLKHIFDLLKCKINTYGVFDLDGERSDRLVFLDSLPLAEPGFRDLNIQNIFSSNILFTVVLPESHVWHVWHGRELVVEHCEHE